MINLLWTFRVDRGNPDVAAKLKEAIELRSAGRGVLPTTLGDERRYNAFMRLPSFVGAAPQTDGGSQEQMEVDPGVQPLLCTLHLRLQKPKSPQKVHINIACRPK